MKEVLRLSNWIVGAIIVIILVPSLYIGWELYFGLESDIATANTRHVLAELVTIQLVLSGLIALLLIIAHRSKVRAKTLAATLHEIETLKEFHENIIATMPSALLVLNSSLEILSCNQKFMTMLPAYEESILGKSICQALMCDGFSHANIDSHETCPLRQILLCVLQDEGTVMNEVIALDFPQQGKRWLEISAVAISNTGQKLLVIINDVTEKHKLQDEINQRRDYIESLFRDVPDAIVATDSTLRIVEWNPGATRLFGYNKDEATGRNIDDLISGKDGFFESNSFNKIITSGEQISPREAVRYCKGGKPVHVILSASPIHSDNSVIGCVLVYHDISALKEAEKELRIKEKAIASSVSAMAIVDAECRLVYVNASFLKLWGYDSEQEVLGRSILDFWQEEEEANDITKELLNRGEWIGELLAKRKDNSTFSAHLSTSIVKDEVGKPICMMASVIDISERKQAYIALRESEQRFQQVVENAQEWIWEVDTDGLYTYSSHTIEKILGYKPEEIIGKKHFYDFFLSEERKSLKKQAFKVFKERKAFTEFINKNVHKNGEMVWLSTSGIPLQDEHGDLIGYRGADIDITDRVNAEYALRESEEKFRNLAEQSPNMIFINQGGRIVYANEKCEDVMGYSRKEIYAPNFDFLTPVAREWIETAKEKYRIKLAGEDLPPYEIALITKAGKRIEVLLSSKLITYEGKAAILGIITDITEFKQAKEAMIESEERYKDLVEKAGMAILADDSEGKSVYYNEKYAELFGYTIEEIREQSIETLIHPKDIDRVMQYHSGRLCGEDVPSRYEYRGIRKDGSIVHHEIDVTVLKEGDELVGTLSYIWDITDRKQMEEALQQNEEQLRHAQKMEAVGQLAGGIAHDFNNLLTAISGHLDFAESSNQPDASTIADLQEIRKASDRAADLIKQLLVFSRRQTLEIKVLDMNGIIEDIEKMLRRIIGENIELIIRPGTNLWKIKTDPTQIEQIIINLVVNARDAMTEGGTITIETSNVTVDGQYQEVLPDTALGSYVSLSISDTGIGMSEAVTARIFEPYFTTKALGNGSGLGLSTIYGIIKQSGGYIAVESAVGQGSTFRVFLPIHSKQGKTGSRHNRSSSEIPTGTETILVVEDEDSVRNLSTRILKRQGYSVLEAQNGQEALQLCRQLDKPVDLVVTDIIMPVMGGVELAKQLTEMWRHVKILFMSGYTANAMSQLGKIEPTENYLQKPFRLATLTQKVREVLEKQVYD